MQKDITVIGAAIIDILAGPVNEKLFHTGSVPMQMTRMSFGGDALNEAVVLSRMGKNVELISKLGNDEAGKRVLDYIKGNNINVDKITVLTGETNPLTNAKLLVEAGAKCAVVKCGKDGCIIHTKEETYEIPVYSVENVIDTTGVGDSFAAGFLYALSEGMSLEECGRFACATASCAIECVGATEGIKSVKEPMIRFQSVEKYVKI